jgi:hypothetical protein
VAHAQQGLVHSREVQAQRLLVDVALRYKTALHCL